MYKRRRNKDRHNILLGTRFMAPFHAQIEGIWMQSILNESVVQVFLSYVTVDGEFTGAILILCGWEKFLKR